MLVRRRGHPRSPRLPGANVRSWRVTSFSTPGWWVREDEGWSSAPWRWRIDRNSFDPVHKTTQCTALTEPRILWMYLLVSTPNSTLSCSRYNSACQASEISHTHGIPTAIYRSGRPSVPQYFARTTVYCSANSQGWDSAAWARLGRRFRRFRRRGFCASLQLPS